MKTILALVLISIFTVSCSPQAKVVTADLVSAALSTATVTALDCQSKDVVKTDVTNVVNKWFNIQATNKSIVTDLCKTAISEVVPLLIGTAIPATWNCKQNKLDNAAVVLSDLACASIK